jgi:hypothetical protein
MKKLFIFLFAGSMALLTSCGSNSENDSLSNPRQTDDVNARNDEADRIHDSVQNSNGVSMNDTIAGSASVSSGGSNISADSSRK